jgi:hypothetical protein
MSPRDFEKTVQIKMGAVANGLMKYPITGKIPPTKWKIVAKLLSMEPITNRFVLGKSLNAS